MNSGEIRDYCKKSESELIALTKSVTSIPAPSHFEERRAGFICDWLNENGGHAYIDDAKNVLMPMGCEGKSGIRVFAAHTDTVFPERDGNIPVREEGGRLFAPGVGDDSANAAILMLCAKYILKNGLAPREPVLFAFNSCEEGLGNLMGTLEYMRAFEGRLKEVVSFDGYVGGIVDRAVGSHRWRISVRTCGGHSYADFGRENAIHRLALLISRLYAKKLPAKPGARTTFNVGSISGGTSVNAIAQEASMLYEYRSDDAECLSYMKSSLIDEINGTSCKEAEIEAELLGIRPCTGRVDAAAENALIARCGEAVFAATGKRPALHSSSTDANAPLSRGIPATSLGLIAGGGAHTREEWVDAASLVPGLSIALSLVTEWFD